MNVLATRTEAEYLREEDHAQLTGHAPSCAPPYAAKNIREQRSLIKILLD
jgi:hypothetical protein